MAEIDGIGRGAEKEKRFRELYGSAVLDPNASRDNKRVGESVAQESKCPLQAKHATCDRTCQAKYARRQEPLTRALQKAFRRRPRDEHAGQEFDTPGIQDEGDRECPVSIQTKVANRLSN